MEYLYFKTHTRRRLFPGALRCLSRLLLWAMLCFGLYQGAALACAQQELSQKVVRFHILAHSDTAADQSVKLSVRDAVLEALSLWPISTLTGTLPLKPPKRLWRPKGFPCR